jgi:hypothetical protein
MWIGLIRFNHQIEAQDRQGTAAEILVAAAAR